MAGDRGARFPRAKRLFRRTPHEHTWLGSGRIRCSWRRWSLNSCLANPSFSGTLVVPSAESAETGHGVANELQLVSM